ncbi:uncharacterized protein C8orf34 homolog isoform X2 [Tubulanus polymorphus]|uniref:uncharacterized protein C8orf34 homolog isoform X2 n=1 Tax=Tubulanus polymorphus TaxID=672921 RepID=UPI003DA616CA
MTSQIRVQSYLEKHQISALFEELMAKIIHTQPDDPLIYLSAVIERKIERKRGSASANRRSTGDLRGERPSTVAWASVDGGVTGAKDRGNYEKPWQTNSRRKPQTKHSPPELTKPHTVKSRPSWNADNKVPSADFDELWNIRTDGTTGKTRQMTRDRSRSRERAADDPNALTFQSSGYYGPVRPHYGDPLSDELPIQRTSKQNQSDRKSVVSSKLKGQKNQANRHRSQLKDLVAKQTAADSGIEDDSRPDYDVDYAVDVMESADDLRNEGVRNVKSTGVRLAKTFSADPEPLVRVSICSRCARVVTGSDPVTNNQPENNGGETSRSSAVRFTPTPVSDDEFESVSQVSGPRRPVWQGDTDAESQALSPRKGLPMYESSGVPHKGRPMYKQTSRDESVVSLPVNASTPTAPAADSVVATGSIVAGLPPVAPDTSRTDDTSLPTAKPVWSRKDSVDFEERNVDSPDVLASKGRSWAIPDDSEVSDIDWENYRATKTKFKSHKSKTYTGGQY